MEKQIIIGEGVSAATRADASRPTYGPVAEPSPSPAQRKVLGRQVTAIGDSVMSAGAMALDFVLPGIYIDAKPSRQMPAGMDVVRSLATAGDCARSWWSALAPTTSSPPASSTS